jgi:hypothetical protein
VGKRRVYVRNALGTLLRAYWRNQAYQERLQALLGTNFQAIDSVSNMICLNPVLRTWWGKGYFGLEPRERLPNGVRVRLRWLKRPPFVYGDEMADLATDPRVHLRWPAERGAVAMRDMSTGHPLLDGSLYDITSSDPSTEVSYDILQLQWDLLRLAVLSGAAEAANDPSWDPDPDMPELEVIDPHEEEVSASATPALEIPARE